MDRYAARINLHGTNQRERMVNRLKTELLTKLPDSLSYKEVKLNGVETQLVINSGTKPYYKDFQSLPGQFIQMGDYIEWSNRTWLVHEADSDTEVYTDGKMYECNYRLWWQNEKGRLVSRMAYIQNASSYSNGEEKNKVLTLASNQFMVWMPLDEETIKLRNGKRMVIDNYTVEPSCYKLTRPDTVTMKFGNKGCTYYIFSQTEFNHETDQKIRLLDGTEIWICDYVEKQQKTPSNAEVTSLPLARIKGSQILKCGYERTYTVEFMDENNNSIDWNLIDFNWKVISDFNIEQIVCGDKITLFTNDENLIGDSFLLQIINNDKIVCEIDIDIADIV